MLQILSTVYDKLIKLNEQEFTSILYQIHQTSHINLNLYRSQVILAYEMKVCLCKKVNFG